MIARLFIFLVLNFGALAIGGLFTGTGVPSDWYVDLNKAPWTPPGWVFGAAWTTIMICFSFYMAFLWKLGEHKNKIVILFSIQWVLNVGWNPVFFYFHEVAAGLFIISLLTLLVAYFLFTYWPTLKVKSMLILPYLIWLIIATSLNGYILFNN